MPRLRKDKGFNMPPTVIDASTLKMMQELHLKGDVLIKGDVPIGVYITVHDGDLTVEGNLKSNVTLDVTSGNATFHDAGLNCKIIASKGTITFNSMPYNPSDYPSQLLKGGFIHGKTSGKGTSIESTIGDICVEHLGHEQTLQSAKDIVFKSAGPGSKVKDLKGKVYFLEDDDGFTFASGIPKNKIIQRDWDKRFDVPPVVQKKKKKKTTPTAIVQEVTHDQIIDAQRAAALEKGQGI